jgi:ribosome maturation factor RimP
VVVERTHEAGLDRVRALAGRVAASYGLDIFDVQWRRESIGWVLRVVLDRAAPVDGGPEPLDAPGVTIADCQRVSEDLSALLDVEEETIADLVGDQPYTLEVSSPGLDRPLRHEADYRRFVGRRAKIVVSAPIGGQTHFAGRLAGVADGCVVLEEGRRTHRIPFGAIVRGRLDVEF